jgi:hypothetical protein
MKWSVIYSVDTRADNSLDEFIPTSDEWEMTEGDESYEFVYMDDEYDGGKHGKYVGYLTNNQFKKFLSQILVPSFVENTMGMLGGLVEDGIFLGLMPAWSLSPANYYVNEPFNQTAYVCPFPENDEEHSMLSKMNDNDVRSWIEENYL